MIYAKTGMERMPENCWDCDLEIAIMCLPTRKRIQNDGRPDWCPLTEIDETLPAQLAAVEMRIKRLDRLIDTKEDKHAI
jgi:hypothetical protein